MPWVNSLGWIQLSISVLSGCPPTSLVNHRSIMGVVHASGCWLLEAGALWLSSMWSISLSNLPRLILIVETGVWEIQLKCLFGLRPNLITGATPHSLDYSKSQGQPRFSGLEIDYIAKGIIIGRDGELGPFFPSIYHTCHDPRLIVLCNEMK